MDSNDWTPTDEKAPAPNQDVLVFDEYTHDVGIDVWTTNGVWETGHDWSHWTEYNPPDLTTYV